VGCKGVGGCEKWRGGRGFTLTMWDVKQVIDVKVHLNSKVLP